jgi:hypothetical protein
MNALEQVGVRPDSQHISKLVRPAASLTHGPSKLVCAPLVSAP